MDDNQFDGLSRRLAAIFTRRAAMKGVPAGLLAAAGLRRAAGAQVSQVSCGNRRCRTNPGACAEGCVCCVWGNGNSRCTAPGDCGSGGTITCAENVPNFCPSIGRCAECCADSDCPPPFDFCFNNQCDFGCFVAGTHIAMADGSSRPIELVGAGDLVLGQSGRANRVVRVALPLLGDRPLYALNGSLPFVTAEHPFGTEAGWKSVDPSATARTNPDLRVRRLQVGDRLLALAAARIPAMAGGGTIDAAEIWLEPAALRSLIGVPADPATQLYNLILDGDHAYFANEMLVHNKT